MEATMGKMGFREALSTGRRSPLSHEKDDRS